MEVVDPSTGHIDERPVLSVALSRESADTLKFESIDPSDAIEKLPHRGDAKASRKSGDFVSILPLTPDDLENRASRIDEWSRVLNEARRSIGAIVEIRERLSRTLNRPQPTA